MPTQHALFCIDSNTKKSTLSQQFMTHVAPPLSNHQWIVVRVRLQSSHQWIVGRVRLHFIAAFFVIVVVVTVSF